MPSLYQVEKCIKGDTDMHIPQYESKVEMFFELKLSIMKRLYAVQKLLDNHYKLKTVVYNPKLAREQIREEIKLMKEEWNKMNTVYRPRSKLSSMELNYQVILNELEKRIEIINDEQMLIFSRYNSDSMIIGVRNLGFSTKKKPDPKLEQQNEHWSFKKKNEKTCPPKYQLNVGMAFLELCDKQPKKVRFSNIVIQKNM